MPRIILMTFVLIVGNNCIAEASFDYLQMDKKRCYLVHAGTMLKSVVYQGKKSFGRCMVVVPVSEFSKRYSHCALSGVFVSPGKRISCDFGYYDKAKTRVHFSNGPDSVCLFMCVRKQKQ